MRKIILLIVALALLPFVAGHTDYAIVNNSTSGQTAHDSLSIPFFLLDSAGNQVAIADGDSVHLIVWYPGGAVAFQDSGAYNDADITTQTRHGMSWYSWQAQVSNLDGTPTEGTYKYHFSIHDKTSAALWTTFTGAFQLYATADLDVTLNYLDAAIASRSSHTATNVWAVGTRTITGGALTTPADYKADVSALALQAEVVNIDGWNPATDQVTADVTAISGDADAADSLEEACDGYDNTSWTLFETLVALSKYFGACDDCYQILYPEDGSLNKDSVFIIDPSLTGADTLIGLIIFQHSEEPSVYDTSYFDVDPTY